MTAATIGRFGIATHEAGSIRQRTMYSPEAGEYESPEATGAPAAAAPLLALQRTAGNHAVDALVRSSIGSGGVALGADVRDDMTRRFGHDFSDVRIHADAEAARSANALQARAFTFGRNIVFGTDRYAPHTSDGRRLLAHELAHVVQQSRGGVAPQAGVPNAALEADADTAAAAIDGGEPGVAVAASSGVGVACAPLSSAEIAKLSREQLEARLLENEKEYSQKVWAPEVYQQLEDENIAIKEALASGTSASSRTPVPEPPPGVPKLKEEEPEPTEETEPNPLLPADPAAAKSMEFKGIAPYGLPEVPVTQGSGPTRTLKAGPYILGPAALQCQNGEWATLYYVAYHKDKKENHWVVGPDSVDKFTAEADERAKEGKQGDKDPRGIRMPGATIPLSKEHAAEQKQTGMTLAYQVDALPYTSGGTSFETIDAGPYRLIPKSVKTAQGDEQLLYYAAWDKKTNVMHWVVGPDSVAAFKASADSKNLEGTFAYANGEPHKYESESVKFTEKAMAGDWGAAWGHWKNSWSEAVKDPKWQLQAVAAHVPVHRIAAPLVRPLVQPLTRTARATTIAFFLGTRRAAPAITMDVAPKALIQATEQGAAAEVRQVASQQATRAVAPEAAQAVTREAAPVVAGSSAQAPMASSLAAPVADAAAQGAQVTGARSVAPETDRDVEQSFTEWAGPAQGPTSQPPLRRVTRTQEAEDTRDAFNRIRDGYAQALGVAAYGQVHHAIEVQVLSRYPGVYTQGEINQASSMRGIPPELNRRTQLHNSKIREILDRHYRALDDEIARRGLQPGTQEYNNLVRSYMDSAVAQVDWQLGIFFSEQRAGLPLLYTPQ